MKLIDTNEKLINDKEDIKKKMLLSKLICYIKTYFETLFRDHGLKIICQLLFNR